MREKIDFTRIIGTGAQAKVYEVDGYAIKVFNQGYDKKHAFYEAWINSIIESSGIPTAKNYEVININGQSAIKMDYIKGKTLQDMILQDKDKTMFYIEKMIDLQIEIHSKHVQLPLTMKSRLTNRIENNKFLNDDQRRKLLNRLLELPHGNSICHGDYHGYNVMIEEEEYKIIDWIDVTEGCPEGDVCRTYILYHFYEPKLAEMYLECYCEKKHIEKSKVLNWMPVVGAARLLENNGENKEEVFQWIEKIND